MHRRSLAQPYHCGEMPVRATTRGAARTPLGARLRRAGVRRELRRTGDRPRARGRGRARADDRPLRDRRAPDLRLRDADALAAARWTCRPRMRQTLRRAGRAHAVAHVALAAALVVLDVRLPRAVRAAVGAGRRRRAGVRDRDGDRPRRLDGAHRPRLADARRWSSMGSAGGECCPTGRRSSRPNARLSRGLEVHPPGRGEEMELWVDTRYVRAGYSWSFPPPTSCASASARSGLPPRQGADRQAGGRPRPAGAGLPGQLDPPPAARGRRGRRVLRRRLGRALSPIDRRGHSHGAVLRTGVRSRAARRARRPALARAGAGALRRLLGRARAQVRLDCCACSRPSADHAEPLVDGLDPRLREPAPVRLGVRSVPGDRAAGVRRRRRRAR